MHRKIPHKRKIRNTVKKVIIVCCIFCSTLFILIVSYSIASGSKTLASPLALVTNKIKQLTHEQNSTQQLQNELDKNGVQFLSITPAQENTMLVKLPDEQEIIFSNSKNLSQQIASLQLIVRQLTIEGKRFHRIDFRFNNPVVTF